MKMNKKGDTERLAKACNDLTNMINQDMNIKEFMKKNNVSAYKIAKILNISQMSVSRWVNGQSPIPPKRIQELKEWEELQNENDDE